MTSERPRSALRWGVLGLVFLGPLPFGSVQPGMVLAIELFAAALGLGTIFLLARDEEARRTLPRMPMAVCAGVIALGVLQLVPLPFGIAERFNPTAELVRPLLPHLGGASPTVTWTVASEGTRDALLRFVAYALIGATAFVAFDSSRARRHFALGLMAAAVFQAAYGSGEYLTGRQHIFGFVKKYYLDSATGTFINRNHFATFLAMALPFAITLAIPRETGHAPRHWRQRLVGLSKAPALLSVFAIVGAMVIWMGLLLSHSRAGLVASLVGAAVVLVHFHGRRARRWAVAIGGAVLMLLLTLDLAQAPGERFFAVSDDLSAKAGRLSVWRDAWELVAARPVFGWGLGTFESTFPLVQSANIDVHYDHAHNDWVEWATEGGVCALTAAVLLLAAALRRGDAATRGAVAAIAAHAVWDFSLRIPAVAATAAAIVGVGCSAYAASMASRAETSAFPPLSMNDSNHSSRLSKFQIR